VSVSLGMVLIYRSSNCVKILKTGAKERKSYFIRIL